MAESGMPDLGEKVGPLPLWGWGVALAGGYLIFRHFSPAKPGAVTVPSAQAADAALAGTVVPSSAGSGGSVPAGAAGGPTSNADWLRAGVTALLGQHADPVTSENALNKFLSGVALTPAERTLVDAAIRAIGPPPEGVPISTTTGAPGPPAPAPPGSGGTQIPLPAGTWKIPGEYTVGSIVPQSGKGTWYLSNYGGVAAVGGAPFYGSAFTRGLHAPLPPSPASWRWSSISHYGQHGYQIHSTRGDSAVFGS